MAILILFIGLLRLAFAQTYPTLTGHVNDFATLLTPAYKQSLERELADFKPIAQIALVTIDSLQGDTIENYSNKLFEKWALGDKKTDNGLLFIISKQDRKVRLEVGYGLEAYIPDGLAGEILNKHVTPDFKKDDYSSGVASGISEIKKIIQAKQIYSPPKKTSSINLDSLWALIFLLLFFGPYLAAYLARSQSIWAGGIAGAILGYFFFSLEGALISGVIGLILDWFLSKNYDYFKKIGDDPSFRPTNGGFYSGTSGGFWKSSSGGGFGGFGGGSSGGGGASSSW